MVKREYSTPACRRGSKQAGNIFPPAEPFHDVMRSDNDNGGTGKLPNSGDYKTYISTINSKRVRYALEVIITN
jgi:hypothetical protein